jgi:ubiquinone biosynthesis O-methyltransferase
LLPISQKATLKSIVKTMKHYDMFKDENEQFFYSVYMHFIEKKVHEIFGERNIKILDAGCGQGRLTIPLAKNGHQVTGMDLSPDVINLAEKYAKDANVTIELLTGNIEEDLIKFSPQQFDCVICLEVLYMLKNYKSIISNLVKLVKPGGLIILSLRPKLFYVLYTIMNGNFNEAAKLVLHEENYINSMQLNCLTRAEMIDLLSTNGINNIETNGIGILSGIEGDPQARFVVPSKINKKDTEILYQMELKLSEKYCDNARYILVSGVKS